MKIDILTGPEADSWIEDKESREKWKKLYDKCPWATVCQSEGFVVTWYAAYRNEWNPVIIVSTRSDGEMAGLLTLAVSENSGELVAAGGYQAEYQVWLADPQDGNTFIESALQILSEHFPKKTLRFLFVPPHTPLEWVAPGSAWDGRCIVRRISRGLMITGDGGAFRESLRKKSNKSRLNRLGQMGSLRFERITTAEELEAVFDEIMTHGTLRLGAIHNVEFSHDPFKKPFYVEMMRVPGLIHATLLRVGDRIASAHVGLYNRGQVLLGILTHSPFFAKHSPGKLHLRMLGAELAKEGILALDLTPGGRYKERFATHQDNAYVFTVFFNRAQYIQYTIKRKLITGAKSAIQAANLTPSQAQHVGMPLRHRWVHLKATSLLPKLYRIAKARLWETREMRIYRYDAEMARNIPVPQLINRDCLPDLLAYRTTEAWQPQKNDFLKGALEKFESGNHLYTRVEDGRLVHYGWLIQHQERLPLPEVGYTLHIPSASAVLTARYTHPTARENRVYEQLLYRMLYDAAMIPGTKHIYIGVLADDHPSRYIIEKIGFVYQFSFFTRTIGGKTARWTNAPQEFTRPEAINCALINS